MTATPTADQPGCSPFWQCTAAQLILRAILGGVFLQSGWAKLGMMPQFVQAVENYKLLSPDMSYFYAHALPWLELLAGVYLLLGLFLPFAALLTGGLLASFMIAIAIVLVRGDAIDCGCFVGGKEEPVTWGLFARDALMLLGSAYLYKIKNPRFSLDQWLAD